MQHKNPKHPDGGRIFRSGLYSTAILAAAVVLAVLVNLAIQVVGSINKIYVTLEVN